jgi:hypothetical protein
MSLYLRAWKWAGQSWGRRKRWKPGLSRSLLLISRLVTLNGAFFSCSLGAIEESRHVSLMIRTNSLSWVQRWMCRINQSFLTKLLLLPLSKKMQWNFISTSWAYDLQSRLVDQQQQWYMHLGKEKKRKETSTDLLTSVCSLKYAYLIADLHLDSKPKNHWSSSWCNSGVVVTLKTGVFLGFFFGCF